MSGRGALALSVLVHLLVVIACGLRSLRPSALDDALRRTPQETVAITTEIRFEHRARKVRPARERVTVEGRLGVLRRGEGVYYLIRSWVTAGRRFYELGYRVMYPDGHVESGRVPWPVQFEPGRDPFERSDAARRNIALPSPPPDYMPPGTLGKALRGYFPNLVFTDDG